MLGARPEVFWSAVAIIAAILLCIEGYWMHDRKRRTQRQEEEWAHTMRSIRSTLSDPERQKVVHSITGSDALVSGQALLDQVCESTATALGAPAAVITVVEHQGQRWLAYYGAEWCGPETRMGLLQPLETSYCQYVVATNDSLVIEDSFKDIRVATNAQGTREEVRAYLGAPVRTSEGVVVGSLCVFDNRPRRWTPRDRAVVEAFAGIVVL